MNFNLWKKNRQCKVVHNGIRRKLKSFFFETTFIFYFYPKSYSLANYWRSGKPRLFLTLKTTYIFSIWDDFCAFSVQDLLWTLNKGFVFSSHASHDKKVTRLTARKIQDSNANVDKFGLKYKAFCRKNVVGVNAQRKTWGLKNSSTFYSYYYHFFLFSF